MSLESLVEAARAAKDKGEFFKQAKQLALTLLTSETVDEEEIERRFAICSTCPHSKISNQGELICGQCGCATVQDKHKLLNKLRYKELPDGKPVCPEKKF